MGRASGRRQNSDADLRDAIREGALLRVRPKVMTVAVIVAGLLPIMYGTGTDQKSCSASRPQWSAV